MNAEHSSDAADGLHDKAETRAHGERRRSTAQRRREPTSVATPLALSPAIDRAGQVRGHWLDWRACACGAMHPAQGATDQTGSALQDFMRVRGLSALQGTPGVGTLVVPVHWATLVQHGQRYMRVLRQGMSDHWMLCLEVVAPQDIDAMSGLVRFAAEQQRCSGTGGHGLAIALALAAEDLPLGPALAEAIGARHVSLDSSAIRRLCGVHVSPLARADGRCLDDLQRFALVACTHNATERSCALKLNVQWLRGEAVAVATTVPTLPTVPTPH